VEGINFPSTFTLTDKIMAMMNQPMNPDATKPPGGGYMGGEGMNGDMDEPMPEGASESPETFEVDLEAFGGSQPAEGSTFKCKVVSVDRDSGSVTAEVMPMAKRGRGIQEAASEFEPGGGMS
jgi:hypothetical protein